MSTEKAEVLLGVDQEGSTTNTTDVEAEHYGRLSVNVESCINTLLIFVEDRWPEHYREGALRSLRRTIREEIRLAVDRELAVDPSRSTPNPLTVDTTDA